MVIKVIKSGAKLLYSVFQITESLRKSLTTVQIVSIVYLAGLSWIFQTGEEKKTLFLGFGLVSLHLESAGKI